VAPNSRRKVQLKNRVAKSIKSGALIHNNGVVKKPLVDIKAASRNVIIRPFESFLKNCQLVTNQLSPESFKLHYRQTILKYWITEALRQRRCW
jgi:hypothetical protein